MGATKPVNDLSYEEARAELIEVVQALEAGSQTLEQALALWERGQGLAARCQEWLDQAKTRIEVAALTKGATGQGQSTKRKKSAS